METDEIREELAFAAAEAALAARFGIPADALIPLLFSLQYGGDWSCASGDASAISAVTKTTVYDEASQTGYSLEEIYLFIDPALLEREGTVHRLEKCGSAPARLLVKRPYRVRLGAERTIKMTVHPLEREIRTEDLGTVEIAFSGSTAYGIDHELEHLAGREIRGEKLRVFRFG
ncbi:MAG: Putative metalloprotease [Methanoculleus marisnigri]|uniref:Putative metalloprotease n=1 Tax=Methanoculleus marisnigri TaxID=2198 RepID=A0A101IXP2_9EURY|nr:MAG: Putative metalloprotease [Methanoculleus marisnigri]